MRPTAAEIFVRQRCYEEPRLRTACETGQFHPSSLNQIDTALFLKTEKNKAAAFAKRPFLRRRQ
jgi:hypothetical protein